MKYLVYKILTPLGYQADLWTSAGKKNPTYQDLFADEETRIMRIEATGAKVLKEAPSAVSTPQKPLEATTAPQATFCGVHQVEMKEREGKYGKFYSHAQQVGEEWIYCTGKGYGKK